MKTGLLIISFLLGLTEFCTSQSNVEKRLEIDQLDSVSIEKVNNAQENGIVVISKKLKSNGSNYLWKIDQYSTDLALESSLDFQFSKKFTLKFSFSVDQYSFLYLETRKSEYQIVRLNHKGGSYEIVKGFAPRSKGIKFKVSENRMYVYYNASDKNICKIIDFDSKTEKDFSVNAGRYKGSGVHVNKIEVSKENDEVVFIIDGYDDVSRDLMLSSYSLDGKFQRIVDIGGLSINYLFGTNIQVMGGGNYLIAGSYSEQVSTQAIGIFSTLLNEHNTEFYTETPIVSLKAFDKSVRDESETAKELRKVLETIEISTHPIIVTDEGFFITGEFYRSVYTTSAAAGMFFGLAGVMLSYKFSGYNYEGATMVGFDWEGKLIWDVPLELRLNYQPMKKNLQIEVAENNQNFVLKHPHNNTIKTVVISNDGEVLQEQEDSFNIPLNLEYWYNNSYLSYGEFYLYTVHNEKSVEDKITTKRKAFFIEKIATK